MLVSCFEGMMETKHPYNFVAKMTIEALLEQENAEEKILPMLPRLILPLRKALASKNNQISEAGLDVL